MFEVHVALQYTNLAAPALSELKQEGFTLLGTQVYLNWQSWSGLAAWIKSVHAAGFRAFTLLGWEKTDVAGMTDLVRRSVSAGADVIVLDELITEYEFNQDQLLSIIDAGLKMKQQLQFIVDEYTTESITNAYKWTSYYRCVRVATDNYIDKTTIDLTIKLSAQYGAKRALAWLIFSQGSQSFPCYNELDAWVAYTKQLGVDAAFWYVDESGTWQAKWQSVASF
jgi:hypothetical protein